MSHRFRTRPATCLQQRQRIQLDQDIEREHDVRRSMPPSLIDGAPDVSVRNIGFFGRHGGGVMSGGAVATQ
jgi:hypothetical protein